MSMIKEFRAFIARGNVLDLAVGVIIGGAFGKIVASLVGDIIMPLIGILSGGIDFKSLSATIGSATVMYGNFIQCVIDFMIIALCVFLIVKLFSRFRKKKEEAPPPSPVPTAEELLLAEIRDLLKEKR